MSEPSLVDLVSEFGLTVAQRFATGAGEPEDLLRGPFEFLLSELGVLVGIPSVVMAGEHHLADERVRPDYAVHVSRTLIGFAELKAPGRGVDTSRYRGHDRQQWERLACLPNVLYSDGQSFALYRYGERVGQIIRLTGDVQTASRALTAPDDQLLGLIEDFLRWEPVAPRRPRELALSTARLCRLLRAEVEELLLTEHGLEALAEDWRVLLFPDASDAEFADGYAQTVTFALLLARVEGIQLTGRKLRDVAEELGSQHTLMGQALDVLTSSAVLHEQAVSVRILQRVLGVVDWPTVSRGDPAAWLYFYETFLDGYDPILRRATGSYYTPVEAVDPIVNLVDQLLVRRLNCQRGFASPGVTVIDPGVGTGTFLFRILDRIACAVRDDEGEGAVGPQLHQLAKHLIGFELQAGPYSVAEVRLASELVRRGVAPGTTPLRLFLTDTLADPNEPEHHLAAIYAPIAASRSKANEIKRHEPVMVVIGNPPYREHSRGRGGWVEYGDPGPVRERHALLADFIPPREWGLGAHVKHLYNPYVYFWRWATWKVFEGHPNDRGVVAFITVAGYLNGPGFAAMRAYLRRTADAVWIIDCSPEGYQPDVATRIFQGVQQPVCITIALRDGSTDPGTPAPVRYISVHGRREEKFAALGALDIDDEEWRPCPTDWRAPFLPLGDDTWTSYPTLEQLLGWSSPGVTAHRTWVMDPNKDVLAERSARLLEAESRDEKATLLKETRDSKLSTVRHPLPGFSAGAISLADDRAKALDPPIRYGWRSFDRQWILPDVRLIHDPRRPLWQIRNAPGQVYLTGLMAHSPSSGPALTATDLIPDLHHYRGSFGGRTWPLWLDSAGTRPNVVPGLLAHLDDRFEVEVTGEDLFSYIAAVLANPAYTSRFADDLLVPGLRVPLTADASLFAEASAIGRRVLWLHTYGQRFSDPATGRPPGPPRVPGIRRPQVIATIPDTEVGMPESVEYDAVEQVLSVGVGRIHPVEPAVWDYGVSGMKIVKRWFDRRKRQPDGRRSSPLDDIVALSWPPEWTSELLDLLHVLTLLVDLEPQLQDLLDRIVDNALISEADLHAADVLPVINRPEVEMPEQGLGRLF